MIRHDKKKNVAARELAYFIWRMMTRNISIHPRQAHQVRLSVKGKLHRFAAPDSHPSLM